MLAAVFALALLDALFVAAVQQFGNGDDGFQQGQQEDPGNHQHQGTHHYAGPGKEGGDGEDDSAGPQQQAVLPAHLGGNSVIDEELPDGEKQQQGRENEPDDAVGDEDDAKVDDKERHDERRQIGVQGAADLALVQPDEHRHKDGSCQPGEFRHHHGGAYDEGIVAGSHIDEKEDPEQEYAQKGNDHSLVVPEPFPLAHTAFHKPFVYNEGGNKGGQQQDGQQHEGVNEHDRTSPGADNVFFHAQVQAIAAADVFPGPADAARQGGKGFEIIALSLHEEFLLHGGVLVLGIDVCAAKEFVRLLVVLVVFLNLLELAPVIGYNLFRHIQAAVPHRNGGLVHREGGFSSDEFGGIHDGGIGLGQCHRYGIQGHGHFPFLDNLFCRTLRRHFSQGEHQAVVPVHLGREGGLDFVVGGALALELLVLMGYFVQGEGEVEGVFGHLGVEHQGQLVALVNELYQALVLLLDPFFHAPAELEHPAVGFLQFHQKYGERLVQVLFLEHRPDRSCQYHQSPQGCHQSFLHSLPCSFTNHKDTENGLF